MGKNSKDVGVEVRSAGAKGTGLFSTCDFKKGEAVYTYPPGKIVTKEEIPSLSEKERCHLDRIDEQTFEVIQEPACFVNHSCEPNMEERSRVAYALRDIAAGEEVTIDYDQVASWEPSFKCRCGSKNCRGMIGGME